ncbi:MAG: stage 0 sporulation protein [Nitrospiraceae bacterium]|jgi:cell fate regulator YaaT (PSP1 superfamily)|nr:MAG: stage 0 sporulation protein [Nitrospiraceae bacterium]
MPNVVGIRFKSCGKIYDFEINGLEVRKGDRVIIDSEFGLSIGNVAVDAHFVEKSAKELKKVLRRASEEDLHQKQENEKFEKEAKSFCYERIMARGLPMKLVCSEAALDRKRIVFYFTADGRIDFRELVKDLAAKFKTRIEMRQIGVRDKAKLVGGLGVCGKELCCRLFLTSFEPISIKMAKQQELSLNTGKLSGSCGRLMCCLGYEYSEGEGRSGQKEILETIIETERGELIEVVDESMDTLTPELISTPADQKMENLPSTQEKKEEQKPDGAAARKRRRRRRPRKRGPKKSE